MSTKASRRYVRRFAIAMAAYVVLLLAGIFWANGLSATDPLRYVAMALPIPALVAVAWAVYRYVVESDEMLSRDTVRGLAVGFAGGSLVTFGYGMFQFVGAPPLNWTWVFPIYAVCWAIGGALVARGSR